MERKEVIRSAYRLTGGNNFYDGMITCSTLSGKAVCRLVWDMNQAECDAYLENALSGIPEHFAAGSGYYLSGLLGRYDGAGTGKGESTAPEKCNLSAGGCRYASLYRR